MGRTTRTVVVAYLALAFVAAMASPRLAGHEALPRWRAPLCGPLAPLLFYDDWGLFALMAWFAFTCLFVVSLAAGIRLGDRWRVLQWLLPLSAWMLLPVVPYAAVMLLLSVSSSP